MKRLLMQLSFLLSMVAAVAVASPLAEDTGAGRISSINANALEVSVDGHLFRLSPDFVLHIGQHTLRGMTAAQRINAGDKIHYRARLLPNTDKYAGEIREAWAILQ